MAPHTRARAAAVLGAPALAAAVGLIALAPAFAAFACAVSAAVGWCIWLERHPL